MAHRVNGKLARAHGLDDVLPQHGAVRSISGSNALVPSQAARLADVEEPSIFSLTADPCTSPLWLTGPVTA